MSSAGVNLGAEGGVPNFQALQCRTAVAAKAQDVVRGGEALDFVIWPFCPCASVTTGNLQPGWRKLREHVAASASHAVEINPGARIHGMRSFDSV